MAGDQPKKQPDPVDDLKKGIGLLFRAAKGAVEQLPTDKLEDVVKKGAGVGGGGIENVTETIEKEVFGVAKKKSGSPPPPAPAEAKKEGDAPAQPASPDKPVEPPAVDPATVDTPKRDGA